jgi:hypothetical protein
MKKVFSLLVAFVVMATSLWFSVSIASAAALSVVLHVPGATQEDVENATVFVGSEYYNINCVLKDAETGKVVCKVSEKFAGEGATIFVAGQAFNVELPSTPNGANKSDDQPSDDQPLDDQPLVCGEYEVSGADVEFTYTNPEYGTVTWFVSGATLDEVSDNASSYLGSKVSSFEIVSELYCGEEN